MLTQQSFSTSPLQPLPLNDFSISSPRITILNLFSRVGPGEPTWRGPTLDDIDCLSKWDMCTVTLWSCWPRILVISLPDHPTSLSCGTGDTQRALTGSQETHKLANHLHLFVCNLYPLLYFCSYLFRAWCFLISSERRRKAARETQRESKEKEKGRRLQGKGSLS